MGNKVQPMSIKYVYEFNVRLKADEEESETEVLQPTQTHRIATFDIN